MSTWEDEQFSLGMQLCVVQIWIVEGTWSFVGNRQNEPLTCLYVICIRTRYTPFLNEFNVPNQCMYDFDSNELKTLLNYLLGMVMTGLMMKLSNVMYVIMSKTADKNS